MDFILEEARENNMDRNISRKTKTEELIINWVLDATLTGRSPWKIKNYLSDKYLRLRPKI